MIIFIITFLLSAVLAEDVSFQMPLKRRTQSGVFSPVEDAQGTLIPQTACVYLSFSLLDF